ncbi:hypothetical protein [Streptomyces sp. GC420]|uniref:hypothetical protein n=1 Tax=Streptomyces sp. GC420 TaxID=2697568 RepID=UPI001414DDF5|nr:hypothetical protein [Streptomyces sp. GC420]NBM19253.1 hypothetical protein [Streptomyces sp. GC420]
MTTPKQRTALTERHAPGAPTARARLGEWLLTPASSPAAGDAAVILRRGSECVPLSHTSMELELFLTALNQIEADFTRQSTDLAPFDRYGQRTRRGTDA